MRASDSEYRLIFAGIVTSFVPTPVLYAVVQRQFVSGITAGSLEG